MISSNDVKSLYSEDSYATALMRDIAAPTIFGMRNPPKWWNLPRYKSGSDEIRNAMKAAAEIVALGYEFCIGHPDLMARGLEEIRRTWVEAPSKTALPVVGSFSKPSLQLAKLDSL